MERGVSVFGGMILDPDAWAMVQYAPREKRVTHTGWWSASLVRKRTEVFSRAIDQMTNGLAAAHGRVNVPKGSPRRASATPRYRSGRSLAVRHSTMRLIAYSVPPSRLAMTCATPRVGPAVACTSMMPSRA